MPVEAPIYTQADQAREIITEALRAPGRVCVTCSFQVEDVVTVALLREQLPDVPVLFLETGYHFPAVYEYRDQLTERFGLNLVNVGPEQSRADHESAFGLLHQSRPDECCRLRKVGPLFAALADYDVWFTGLRRVQSPTRASLEPIANFPLPSGKQVLKVSPLATWSDAEVWHFARALDLPILSLYTDGYTSIGCEPCTAKPSDPSNPRSGRWAGGNKLECGIHIAAPENK